eukprot:8368125-Pyramimonas_sp.AAC.1
MRRRGARRRRRGCARRADGRPEPSSELRELRALSGPPEVRGAPPCRMFTWCAAALLSTRCRLRRRGSNRPPGRDSEGRPAI